MADKDPKKLAAARKKLKEYQKKSRENAPLAEQPQQSSYVEQKLQESILTEEDNKNYSTISTQFVHNPKIPLGVQEDTVIKRNEPPPISKENEVFSKEDTIKLFNGGTEKSNTDYVNALVTELNSQSIFTASGNDNKITNNHNGNDSGDIKSAKDFFNSLPVSSQSSVDFSLDVQLNSDIPTSVSSNPTISTEVPSVVDVSNFSIKSNTQDSQSEHSESVPVTPSEQENSEISSSSAGHSPKQISYVLESQIQEIDTKLGLEINKNKLLAEQLQQSHIHISQLEDNLESVRKENEIKLNALEEKIQLHMKTLEIVIAEKTELQTTLTTCQESLSQKAGEIEELQSRLRASRHRVSDLEKELGLAQALRQQQEKAAHEATCSRDMLKKEVDLIRKRLEESEEETIGLKHKIEEKSREIKVFKDELQDKESQLSVSQLRIEQLSYPGIENQATGHDFITQLQNDKKVLEQQVKQLNANIKKVMLEKDEGTSQYQQYVATLDSQLQSVTNKYDEVCTERDSLSAREASLVEHMSSLEKQLQLTLPRKPSPPPAQQSAELQQVVKKLEHLNSEKEQLTTQLSTQVSENEKLCDLLEETQSKIMELERTIERLEIERPDANLLQAAIESDKVAASRAIAQNSDLKKQLEELQDAFIKMSNNKLELTEKLDLEQSHCKELSVKLVELQHTNQVCSGQEEDKEKIDFCSQTYNLKDPEPEGIVIDLEAMAKLEEKFTNKMREVAELSDEKQRLEHLVLQLQGETETIGEYIALYQVQRGVLKQKALEKDEQMARLSQEREVLRNKLRELNHLVQSLIPGSENHCIFGVAEEAIETMKSYQNNVIENSNKITQQPGEMDKEETAGKIRALLTEIGSSKLVTPDGDGSINFHPCPWCSGRLITV